MNIPLYAAVLILAALILIAYLLHLPEGWPRAVAFGVITLVGIAMVVVSVRNQSRRK